VGATTARATPITATTYDLVVRPRAALVRSTVLSVVFSAVPLAVALVWVTFPLRLWALVACVVIAVALGAALLFARLRTAYVGVGPDGLTMQGVVTPTRTFTRAEVDRLVLVTTFGSAVDRTSRELVALDASGGHLFRMRALVWDELGLDRVVEALGVQVTEDGRPMPIRDFVRRYPASRAWYERPGSYVLVGLLSTVLLAGVLVAETAGLLHA
jgi:hypothetical protein